MSNLLACNRDSFAPEISHTHVFPMNSPPRGLSVGCTKGFCIILGVGHLSRWKNKFPVTFVTENSCKKENEPRKSLEELSSFDDESSREAQYRLRDGSVSKLWNFSALLSRFQKKSAKLSMLEIVGVNRSRVAFFRISCSRSRGSRC